jgi:hypothetical protein
MTRLPLPAAVLLCLALASSAHARKYKAGDHEAPAGGIVLDRFEYVEGTASATTIHAHPKATGPLISSGGLAKWKASSAGRWDYEKVPTRLLVRDVTLDGRGNCPPYAEKWLENAWPLPTPRAYGLVDLWSPAVRLERVHAFDFPGTAFVIGHGSTTLAEWPNANDREQSRGRELSSMRAYAGMHIVAGADGVFDDLEFYDGLRFGMLVEGAANLISRAHAAGFHGQPVEGDPYRGFGFINGPHANYWGAGIQADNCRVGFLNQGPGTTLESLLSKLCDKTLDARARMSVQNLDIENPGGRLKTPHYNPAPVCITLPAAAAGSSIGDRGSEWSCGDAPHALQCQAAASRLRIRNARSSWGGNKPGTTVVEYGSPLELLEDSDIDICASGYAVGVRLPYKIGKRNRIIVHHRGDCPLPIAPGLGVELEGNDVRVENRGRWEVIATIDPIGTKTP